MIEETARLHDRFQFELKFTYEIGEGNRVKKYDVETYIFFPSTLGINKATYTKNDFYNDIKTYMRLKTPSVLLKNIYSGAGNPIEKLMSSIENLSYGVTQQKLYDFEYRLKIFCSIYKSSLRDELAFITQRSIGKEIEELIDGYLYNSTAVAKGFRALKKMINVPFMDKKCVNLYSYADEYISFMLNESFHALYVFAENRELRKSEIFKEKILKAAKEELGYRKDAGYATIPSDQHDNEALIFRRSAFKKMIGRILYLSTKTEREGVWLEQTLFGLSAAIAMAFATAVAFSSRIKFEDLTAAFFLILIVAYVFKDRMKDWMRNYFSSAIQKYFFDLKTIIYSNLHDKIGVLREDIDFVEKDKIPKDVMEKRDRDFLCGLDDDYVEENILLYKKQIVLYSERFKSIFPDFIISGLNDIMRVDVSKFLSKMDNPEENVYIPKRFEYCTVKGSRVYHMNLIIKAIIQDGGAVFSKFRIVLDKNGIKRVERI